MPSNSSRSKAYKNTHCRDVSAASEKPRPHPRHSRPPRRRSGRSAPAALPRLCAIEVRKEALANLLHSKGELGLQLNEHFHEAGDVIFRHACKLGCEGIVSKRLRVALSVWAVARLAQDEEPGSTAAAKREAEEDWGARR